MPVKSPASWLETRDSYVLPRQEAARSVIARLGVNVTPDECLEFLKHKHKESEIIVCHLIRCRGDGTRPCFCESTSSLENSIDSWFLVDTDFFLVNKCHQEEIKGRIAELARY